VHIRGGRNTLSPGGAFFAPGVCTFASPTPNRGASGAPRDVRVLGAIPAGRAKRVVKGVHPVFDGRWTRVNALMTRRQAFARALSSLGVGRSPRGAPPWRLFTRGRASVSGIASASVERVPRSQVVVPGGGRDDASRLDPSSAPETSPSHFDLASAGIAAAMNGHHRSLIARMSDKIFCRLSSGISLFGFAKSSRLFSTFDQNCAPPILVLS
jgi:hypothetical protein